MVGLKQGVGRLEQRDRSREQGRLVEDQACAARVPANLWSMCLLQMQRQLAGGAGTSCRPAQSHRDEWHNPPMGKLLLQCPESTNPQPAGSSGSLHKQSAASEHDNGGVWPGIFEHALQMIFSVSADYA